MKNGTWLFRSIAVRVGRVLDTAGGDAARLCRDHTSGCANCNPHSFQSFTYVIRTTRARTVRTARGNFTFMRRGVDGISSDTRDQRRKGLRIASSAPPTLALSKVPNSRNSLPRPLIPRTKTGTARASRAQRRRSKSDLVAAESSLPERTGNHNQLENDLLGGGLPQMTS
jgi:hypothetical protein